MYNETIRLERRMPQRGFKIKGRIYFYILDDFFNIRINLCCFKHANLKI